MKSLDIEMRAENHPLQSGICAFLETPIWNMCFFERKTRAHAEFSPKKHIFQTRAPLPTNPELPSERTTELTNASGAVLSYSALTTQGTSSADTAIGPTVTTVASLLPLSQGRLLNRAHKLLLSMDTRLCIDALNMGPDGIFGNHEILCYVAR